MLSLRMLGVIPALLGPWLAFVAAQAPADKPPATQTRTVAAYRLQAGDELEIKAFEVPELTTTVRIRPDGFIAVVLLDDVKAAGLTSAELDEALTAGYAKYYREVELTVVVKSFANLSVYVGGEVGQPGLLPLSGELTALSAVLRAGGFRETGKMDSVILLRRSAEGRPVASRVNLKAVLNGAEPDSVLEPFDVVYVPRTFIASANLFMKQYVRDLLPISTYMNFSYLIAGSGFQNQTPR
jgi:polysaccharide export outer membrane protein